MTQTTHTTKRLLSCLLTGMLLLLGTLWGQEANAQVKLTNSGICYTTQDPQFHQFQGRRAFATLVECLEHGRMPDYDVEAERRNQNTRLDAGRMPITRSAERDSLLQWDTDVLRFWSLRPEGCRDVREVLLARTATQEVQWTPSGCRVQSGQWLDPFTGRMITDPERVDIDHIIPLAWAWGRGAHRWTQNQRHAFYHDRNNAVATTPDFRRQRVAASPLDWNPPDGRAQCGHQERVIRMLMAYDLDVTPQEWNELVARRHQACSRRFVGDRP